MTKRKDVRIKGVRRKNMKWYHWMFLNNWMLSTIELDDKYSDHEIVEVYDEFSLKDLNDELQEDIFIEQNTEEPTTLSSENTANVKYRVAFFEVDGGSEVPYDGGIVFFDDETEQLLGNEHN